MRRATFSLSMVLCLILWGSATAQEEILRTLDKAVSLDKRLTNGCSLKEAVEWLRERSDTRIVIDTRAFKKRRVDNVEQKRLRMSVAGSIRLGLLMDLLVKQADGVCEVHRRHITITPLPENGKTIVLSKTSPKWQEATNRIRQKLQNPAKLEESNANTPCKDALEFLSDRYDLDIVIDFAAFKKGKKRIEIEDAPITLRAQKEVTLGNLLEGVLKQVGASYEIIDGTIVVRPARKKDQV